jgi:hypothetical protein
MIRGLGAETVAQISSGDRHSVALTKGGQLFAWGDNSFGQLGVGRAAGDKVVAPQVNLCLLSFILIELDSMKCHLKFVFPTVFLVKFFCNIFPHSFCYLSEHTFNLRLIVTHF